MESNIKFNVEKTTLGGHLSQKKGVLELTNDYLKFTAFTSETINYSDIKNVSRYKIFGFINTGIKIITNDKQYTFSIVKASKFIDEINNRITV